MLNLALIFYDQYPPLRDHGTIKSSPIQKLYSATYVRPRLSFVFRPFFYPTILFVFCTDVYYDFVPNVLITCILCFSIYNQERRDEKKLVTISHLTSADSGQHVWSSSAVFGNVYLGRILYRHCANTRADQYLRLANLPWDSLFRAASLMRWNSDALNHEYLSISELGEKIRCAKKVQRNLNITKAFVPQDSAIKKEFAAIKNPNTYQYDKW